MVMLVKSAGTRCKLFDAVFSPVELVRDLGNFFCIGFSDVKSWISVPCFVVGLLLSQVCFAGADLNLSANARSYPLSGVAEAQAGYGVVLYGTEGSPFSGYMRLGLDGSSAGSYNSGAAAVELFPLAILGVRAGGESVQNDKDYSAYDCEMLGCQGRFYRTFVEGEVTLGYAGVFAQGKWRRERWTQAKGQVGDFVDPTSGLLMDEAGESQTVYQAVLGYKWSEAWTTMGGLRYAVDDGGDQSQMPFGLLKWTSGGFSVALGGGAFKSALKARDSMVLGYISWDIWPSVKLK